MALIQVRVRPTVRTRAQMGASGSFAGGFVDALRELCGKVDGIEFSGFFVSMAGGEGVAMLSGSPHQVPVVYQVLTWSGAFEYVKAEILIPPEEFNANRAMAETLAAHFRAPNQDEIDRMLLEE
ncbi:MAG: hypothetical protein VX784_01305 [Pseudomonadota bacterium]|nr:hypothetical protein [Pseudomonadota bacterium]